MRTAPIRNGLIALAVMGACLPLLEAGPSANAAAATEQGPAWTPPATLVAHAATVSLGAGAGGQEAAIWSGTGSGTDSGKGGSYRPAGGDWEVPEPIDATGVAGDLVVDASGRVAGAIGSTLVSRASTSTSWTTKDTEAEAFTQITASGTPQVTVEGSGHAFSVVEWEELIDSDGDVTMGSAPHAWQGEQRSDGSWAEIKKGPPYDLRDAASYGGTNLVLTTHAKGIGVSSSVNHGAWTTPALLLPASQQAQSWAPGADLATNSHGAAVAVASFVNGRVAVAYKPAGHSWETATTVQGHALPGSNAVTAATVAGTVSPSGQATVIYVDSNSRVVTMRHPAGGSWTTPQPLSGSLPGPHSLRVSDDGIGNTVAAWGTDMKGASDLAQVSFRPAGGAWQSPVSLGTPQTHGDFTTWDGRADNPDVAIQLAATPGRFTAAFRDGEGWDYSDLNVVTRFGGANRYDTAVNASRATFDPGVARVYVATGRDFADGLAAGPAAAVADGPLLLVPGSTVPPAVTAEIQRLQPGGIVVLGGTSTISASVEQDLGVLAPVERVAGPSRYATAATLATTWTHPSTVYLASGEGFADALSGGGLAAAQGAPLLLTRSGVLPQPTADALASLSPSKVVIVGGTAAVGGTVEKRLHSLLPRATVSRLSGSNRYATSAAVLLAWPAHGDGLVLATGEAFADALAGTPIAAHLHIPLALARPACVPASVHGATTWADHDYLLGGSSAIATGTMTTTCP